MRVPGTESIGDNSGNGGNGGGIYAAGSLQMTNDTVTQDVAGSGANGDDGDGLVGGKAEGRRQRGWHLLRRQPTRPSARHAGEKRCRLAGTGATGYQQLRHQRDQRSRREHLRRQSR